MKNLKSFLTVCEAANIVGVSAKTLRRWDNSRKLESVRHPINRYRLYEKEKLVSLLNQLNPKNGRRNNNDNRNAHKTVKESL